MTTSFAQENNQDSSSYRGFAVQRDTVQTSVNAQISVDTVSSEVPIHEAGEVDSSVVSTNVVSAATVRNPAIIRRREIDTVSVCRRNPVADIIFNSSNYVVPELYLSFPFQFVKKNNETLSEKRESIEKSLKSGEALPAAPFSSDWIIGVIILIIILFSIAYASVKTLFSGIFRFFLFRGTKETETKVTEVFQWQSIFFSISSIFVISIFIYFALLYKGVALVGFSELRIWLLAAASVVIALTLRHLACAATGLMSGATKIFNDYIITIYQTYRFAGFFLFISIALFFYTPLISARSCLISGFTIVAFLYLIRILRLFLLFINNKVSIFYFILYLCALEILPVLVLIKYFSGLV